MMGVAGMGTLFKQRTGLGSSFCLMFSVLFSSLCSDAFAALALSLCTYTLCCSLDFYVAVPLVKSFFGSTTFTVMVPFLSPCKPPFLTLKHPHVVFNAHPVHQLYSLPSTPTPSPNTHLHWLLHSKSTIDIHSQSPFSVYLHGLVLSAMSTAWICAVAVLLQLRHRWASPVSIINASPNLAWLCHIPLNFHILLLFSL